MRASAASLTGFVILTALAAQGQPRLAFEVATVKPAATITGPGLPRGGPGLADPEHVNYRSLSMKNLLMAAYDLPFNQIAGPPWIDTERFDIAATVAPGATKEQATVMLQNLLAERFKLEAHKETKELRPQLDSPSERGVRQCSRPCRWRPVRHWHVRHRPR
ncbi:MAG: TIGR03435 family protein [Acidobacteriota bacterium]